MIFPTLFLLSLWIIVCHCGNITTSEFSQQAICDVTQRITKGCTEDVPGARSLVECALLSTGQDTWIGASWTDQGKCYLHQDCSNLVGKCIVEDTNHQFMAKSCKHGAAWDSRFQYCKCPRGMLGTMCEKYPQNCNDYLRKTESKDREKITLDPQQNEANLLPVLCSSKDRIFVLRNEGWADFNRTMNEYTNGFYIDNDNLFVGLEVLHQLSNAGYTNLEIHFVFHDPLMEKAMYLYDFTVNSDYKFSYGGFKIIFQNEHVPADGLEDDECLNGLQGKPFSTWDQDNDGDNTKNCADRAGWGWWYKPGCGLPCHLLGVGKANWTVGLPDYQKMAVKGVDMSKLVLPGIMQINVIFKK